MSASIGEKCDSGQGMLLSFSPTKQARKQGKKGLFLGRKFTGKELDKETGYGYFGARYYDATLLTGWTAVDPMADKYPNISPYAYYNWNPMKLVDPNGREVYITGDAANQAASQLSSKGITVTRDDETGRLSYTETGKRLSKSDRQLMAAINATDVRVNVYASNSNTVDYDGLSLNNHESMGQFLGVALSDCIGEPRMQKRNAVTKQLVNPSVCQSRDEAYNVELGTSMRHEITESYHAGRICIAEGIILCGPSWKHWEGIDIPQVKGDVYSRAHGLATPQANVRRKQIDASMAAFKTGVQRQYGSYNMLSF